MNDAQQIVIAVTLVLVTVVLITAIPKHPEMCTNNIDCAIMPNMTGCKTVEQFCTFDDKTCQPTITICDEIGVQRIKETQD